MKKTKILTHIKINIKSLNTYFVVKKINFLMLKK